MSFDKIYTLAFFFEEIGEEGNVVSLILIEKGTKPGREGGGGGWSSRIFFFFFKCFLWKEGKKEGKKGKSG